ncbi:Sua5/YciO/YrdC/YwlC family protein [Rhodococcus oxybenzonivorans]|uniref:Sua5/YciO/YrdC/YwlC family protein n=1 Tax=Rhodococcus oxybenzonivorans TaxID=1990687 RepID=UPI001E42B718|nr:Sua5/YciO/YrdC/YwlC family protein [Rhodococcus oxybenzonivorans]
MHALSAAQQRGSDKPASVLVGSMDNLDGMVASVPAPAHQLIHAFWPGSVSLVLQAARSSESPSGRATSQHNRHPQPLSSMIRRQGTDEAAFGTTVIAPATRPMPVRHGVHALHDVS